MRHLPCLALLASVWGNASAVELPSAPDRVSIVLPDYGAELRAFDEADRKPVSWWPYVVNAGWGGGRGGPERRGGWLDENWKLIDYLDRSGDYTTHEYLKHRGIWYEVYGSNEYQETIHFYEGGARELLWDNGIARDMHGERVLSKHYNMSVPSWAERVGWNAFIVCNNAPRWSAIINYDWLTSPLLGFAISQDNIGGPTSRIGAGGHARYCDYCNAKFFHHLAVTDRLPEFRRQYKHIRDYVQDNLADVLAQLPPAVKHRFNAAEAELLAKMCAPPVMSEYQKFLYLSHLHNLVRYYRDAKLVAERMGREYDVHGNQGGGFIGPNPYQVALSDFVDTVWFESKGLSAYDIFKYGWNNAWGAFRFEMGWAMTRGRRPLMCMTGFHKHTPDMVEHEMAEECAGGGVLFVKQSSFEEEPELQQKVTAYFRFRHDHRAIFARESKRRYTQIALAYSVPTMMYHNYQHEAAGAPISALSGMARALEEGHLPFDVFILNHPEIHADRVTLDELRRYRLVILPALECLTDSQIELFTRYLQAGGTLGIIGQCGVRDEDNLPRAEAPAASWKKAGRVVDILSGRNFLPSRTTENDETRELTRAAIEATREALAGATILSGDLPRMLWVKTWEHGGQFVSLHFVNYDIDFESGAATPTEPLRLTVALPGNVPAEAAVWLTPDGKRTPVDMAVDGRRVALTLPSVRVYGVMLIGRQELDSQQSAVLPGDAMLARAKMASGGNWGDLAQQAAAVQEAATGCARPTCTAEEAADYARAAEDLLQAVQHVEDMAYLERARNAVDTYDAMLAFDFGGTQQQPPWQIVEVDTAYSPEAGLGWLPLTDDSVPTPEETYYAMAQRYGAKFTTGLTAGLLPFWPYKEQPPRPLRTNLGSGTPRRFRVDVPAGEHTVRVVTTNPSWTNRNFLVSGMVRANGGVRLLDAVHDRGAIVAREFLVSAPDGKLELTFGGPTGWAVAAVTVRPGVRTQHDPQTTQGLRTWRVSPRYANPDWYPITQVVAPPEERLADVPGADWQVVNAPATGLPVVDLGTKNDAEVGDAVYAATSINSDAPREAYLHFGASSQAQLWLNGASIGYVPNEKGLRRDEFVAPLRLRAGQNTLVLKLERFWERRWVFYASLTDVD